MFYELNGLVDCCASDYTEGALLILEEDNSLDLTYNKGIVFVFAVQHNNIKLLTALKEYYEKHQLSMDKNSAKYAENLEAFHNMMDILEAGEEITSEVRGVIGEYLFDGREQKKLAEIDDMIATLGPSKDLADELPVSEKFVDWPDGLNYGLGHGELSGSPQVVVDA